MPHILLLEPDNQLASNISRYLSERGFTVEVHSDPQGAITAADRHRPDAVVLDLILAGRSGVEFLYELRSYPDWHPIPVIINSRLTAEELHNYSPALYQLNVSSYLYKPTVTLYELAETIQSFLKPLRV